MSTRHHEHMRTPLGRSTDRRRAGAGRIPLDASDGRDSWYRRAVTATAPPLIV